MRKILVTLAVVGLCAVPSQARERGPLMSRLLGPKRPAACQPCQQRPVQPVRQYVAAVAQAVTRPLCSGGTCPRQ